jgi:hypothetical protein
MCVDLWLLDTDFAEQFGKPAPRLPAEDGKISESSRISRSGRGAVGLTCHEPRSPLLENQCPTGPDQPPVRGHLLTAASERSDLVAGMDEIERLRFQLGLEQIIDEKFYVGESLRPQK